MIRGNCVYTLGLITKKGGVVIKDLTKFLVGSLDYNCKSFGIPMEEAKTSFEHEKCKTWEEVEKHKVYKKGEAGQGAWQDSNLHSQLMKVDVLPILSHTTAPY